MEACGWSPAAEAQRAKAQSAAAAAETARKAAQVAAKEANEVRLFEERLRKLRDPDPAIRSRAAGDIGAMLTPNRTAAIPALIELLNDPALEVRGTATMALGSMGPAASAAIGSLEEALKDPRRANMARSLRLALDQIRKGQ